MKGGDKRGLIIFGVIFVIIVVMIIIFFVDPFDWRCQKKTESCKDVEDCCGKELKCIDKKCSKPTPTPTPPTPEPPTPPTPTPPNTGNDCGTEGAWVKGGQVSAPKVVDSACKCKEMFDNFNKDTTGEKSIAWQYAKPSATHNDANTCLLYTGGNFNSSGDPDTKNYIYGKISGDIP